MANLNSMPFEIIDNICLQLRHFCTECDEIDYRFTATKALASLCQTSKKLRLIATPHLYHRVNINDEEANLVPFTRSLLENQNLADLVHELDIEQCQNLKFDQTLQAYILSHPVTSMPTRRLDGFDRKMMSKEWYALRVLEILLVRLRKLRSIVLLAQPNDDCFAEEVLTPIKDKQLHDLEFQHIFKEIVIRGSNIEAEDTALIPVIPLISGTCVQKLQVWDCVHTGEFEHCVLPSLLELRMMNAALNISDFFNIVQWCPNLQLLSYDVGDEVVSKWYADLPSSSDIIEVIAPLGKTLRTLILYQDPNHKPNNEMINPLTDFRKLENLVIGFHDLTDEDADSDKEDSEVEGQSETQGSDSLKNISPFLDSLPRSLRNFCIVDARDSLKKELSELSKRAEKDFPNLRSLIVDASLDLKAFFEDMDIDYQEVNHRSLMYDGLSLEYYFTRCWEQMDRDRRNMRR